MHEELNYGGGLVHLLNQPTELASIALIACVEFMWLPLFFVGIFFVNLWQVALSADTCIGYFESLDCFL